LLNSLGLQRARNGGAMTMKCGSEARAPHLRLPALLDKPR